MLLVLACFSRFSRSALRQQIGLALAGTLTSNGGLHYEKAHTRINRITRGRNINLLSIGYAFRPGLRNRLTLGGLPFPRKPQVFGERDLHPLSRYSYRHSHLVGPPPLLTVWPVSPYQRSSTTHATRRPHESAASVSCLVPFIIGAQFLDG